MEITAMADVILQQFKICAGCKQEKPFSAYGKQKHGLHGLRSRCKSCRAAEAIAARLADPEKFKARSLNWYRANKERAQERLSKWQKENKDQVNAKSKRWRDKNRKEIAEYNRAYKTENRSFVTQLAKKWRTSNPEMAALQRRLRRARKKNSGGTHTKHDIERIHKLQRGCCAVCKKPLNQKYHVDHVIALANGGSNGPENLQLLHPRCNQIKTDKDPIEFMQEQGFLL
jgi:5-methylcytosine-specific restriction endonuclease McrA